MPKKNSRQQQRHISEDQDSYYDGQTDERSVGTSAEDWAFNRDGVSIYSSIGDNMSQTSGLIDRTQEEVLLDIMKGSIEALYEKRASTRESALKLIIKCLKSRVLSEQLINQVETLTDLLLKSMGKEITEMMLSCQAFCLFLITMNDQDDFMKTFIPVYEKLESLFMSSSKQTIQAQCLESMSVFAFVFREIDFSYLIRTIEKAMSVFLNAKKQSTTDGLVCQALWVLCVCLSCHPNVSHCGSSLKTFTLEDYCQIVLKYMESNQLGVRLQAGEMAALLLEVYGADEIEEDFVDEIIVKVGEMSFVSTKKKTKKDNACQRSVFKKILKFIESDESPDETLKFSSVKIVISSWSEQIQLNLVRKVLGEGMNRHFDDNSFLREIFSGTYERTEDETKHKLHNSNNSKSLSKSRTIRENASRRAVSQYHYESGDLD